MRDPVLLESHDTIRVVDYISRYFQGQKALDIGCGTGILVDELVKKRYDAYGVDIRDIYQYDRRRFVQCDARQMPFRDEEFDMVIERLFFSDMKDLQKLPNEELMKAMKEMSRVTKLGGYFIQPLGIYLGEAFLKNHGFELIPETRFEPVCVGYRKIERI